MFLGLLWCNASFAEELQEKIDMEKLIAIQKKIDLEKLDAIKKKTTNEYDLSNLEGVTVTTNSKNELPEAHKYAYKKVYDDWYTCAVYFKFLSRGVERADNLSDKQKNFVNTMKAQSNTSDMEGRDLVEYLNKHTDSNITNEDIQKKVENIYVSFLDIAGRDYSKTGLLNDKYLIICNDLLDNYVPRFEYWKQVYNSNELSPSADNETDNTSSSEKIRLYCEGRQKYAHDTALILDTKNKTVTYKGTTYPSKTWNENKIYFDENEYVGWTIDRVTGSLENTYRSHFYLCKKVKQNAF